MKPIDPAAIRAAFEFPLKHRAAVLAGAGVYAVPYAAQSVFAHFASAGRDGAAPLALVFSVFSFAVFIPVFAAWGRAALGRETPGGLFGLSPGADEGRLAIGLVLVLVLMFTVLGTAGLMAFAVLLGVTLVAASRAGVSAEPETAIDAFALLGPGEWIVAAAAGAAFAAFALWFFARLVFAPFATLDRGRIRILSAWPLSDGRAVQIAASTVIAAVPALIVLWGLDRIAAQLTGAGPASPDGLAAAPAFTAVAFVFGLAKMVLLAAPLTGLYAALYLRAVCETGESADQGKTRAEG